MKARKLPSGSWFARAFSHTDENGKKVYKSFTADTKAEAEFLANKFKYDKKEEVKSDLTVGEAIDKYIDSKDGILSPSTIRGYKQYRNNHLIGIQDIRISALTTHRLQKEITSESKKCSPKTVRNIYGLLTAALSMFSDATFKISLPRIEPPNIQIPSTKQAMELIESVRGSFMEIALLLAANLGARRSEICALTTDDINLETGTVTINKAMVYGSDCQWHIKPPKSKAGNRIIPTSIEVLKYVVDRADPSGKIIIQTPTAITDKYTKLKQKYNLPYRFHDLRHYNASIMLALGIPDKYAMNRIGHATPQMLKNVYQHLMQDKVNEVDSNVIGYFDTELNTVICNEICNDKAKTP